MKKKEEKFVPLIASQKLMIWRTKMKEQDFTNEEITKYEKDVFNDYLSEDVAKTLQETKTIQTNIIDIATQIKKDSFNAKLFFILTVLVAIGTMCFSVYLSQISG